MESFTAQTTDGSGNIDLTLQEDPAADDAIMLYCNIPGYIVEFDSRASKVVTILVTKMSYDKTDTTITGNLSNLPTNVTESSTQFSTDIAGGAQVSAGEGGARPTGTHSHLISYMYRHDHTPGFTETNMTIAASQGGLTITVIYAIA